MSISVTKQSDFVKILQVWNIGHVKISGTKNINHTRQHSKIAKLV